SALIRVEQGSSLQFTEILMIPVSIILGALLGVLIGLCLVWYFKKYHIRDTVKVLMIFSIGFLCIVLEQVLSQFIGISGLVSIMAIGVTLLTKYPVLAKRLVGKFEKIWVIAEIMLFVLVGAVLDIHVVKDAGLLAVLLISISLVFRMLGVIFSLIKTRLSKKEKLFVSVSYIPKATVQAAIGSIPLSIGLLSGQLILSIAVISIIFTAPLGALCIDFFKNRLLSN
ncbi:MAG: sodium:proton antiporter, partial [Bacillota bacterium]